MPPKNNDNALTDFYVGYPGGHYEPLGRIVGLETHFLDEDTESFDTDDLDLNREITLTARLDLTIRDFYFLITGRFPSNNWLKMHGWPMVRRCGYHKRKKHR